MGPPITSSFAMPEAGPSISVILEGWMLKKRGRMLGFVRRYFILHSSGLLSYSVAPGEPFRDQILLLQAGISSVRGRKDIHIDSGIASFHIKCLSMEGFETWNAAFRSLFVSIATRSTFSRSPSTLRPYHASSTNTGANEIHGSSDDISLEGSFRRGRQPSASLGSPLRQTRTAPSISQAHSPSFPPVLPSEAQSAPSTSSTSSLLAEDVYIVSVITHLLGSQSASVSVYTSTLQDCRRSHAPYEECIRLCTTAAPDTNIKGLPDAILCAMQEVYDNKTGVEDSSEARFARRMLMKFSQKIGALPSSIFVQDISCAKAGSPTAMGGFANVFCGSMAGRSIALKRLRTFLSQGTEDEWKRHYSGANCTTITFWSLLDWNERTFDECTCMVSPWMAHGDLAKYIRNRPSVDTKQKLQWVKGVVSGLDYLHDQDVVHGDLRGANILLDDLLQVHIADFGLSKFMDAGLSTMGITTNREGAVRWMAPEVINSGECTTEGDMYSLGCVFLEVFSEMCPFPDLKNEKQVISQINQGKRPKWCVKPDSVDPGVTLLGSIAEKCWSDDLEDRPETETVLNSSVFS